MAVSHLAATPYRAKIKHHIRGRNSTPTRKGLHINEGRRLMTDLTVAWIWETDWASGDTGPREIAGNPW